MFDFSNEDNQKASGAIPKGSSVKVKLTIRKPELAYREGDFLLRAKSGLLALDVEYEVVSGTYKGRKVWDKIWLPAAHQKINLSEGQIQACNMGGARLKAILGAARNTDSDYKTNSFYDFNGLLFGVVVGLTDEPNSKGYWNNTIAKIITPDMPKYAAIMSGGEDITNGPTEGITPEQSSNQPDDGFMDGPSADDYDPSNVPFS